MEKFTFYYDGVLSLKQRIIYLLWGLFIGFHGYVVFSDKPGLRIFFWLEIVLGAGLELVVFCQPYIKKQFGRVYIRFQADGLSWKLRQFGGEHSLARDEIQSVEIHPTSMEVHLKNGGEQKFRFPEIYTMTRDFRNKAVAWVEELEIPWEDWRERQQVVP